MRKNIGFSLVEVMIASFIMLTGFVAMTSFMQTAQRFQDNADRHRAAQQIMQSKYQDLQQFISLRTTNSDNAYQLIGSNTGGRIASGDVAKKINSNEVLFKLSWQATKQYFVDSNGDGRNDTWVSNQSAMRPTPLPQVAHRKQLTIRVDYPLITGEKTSVSMPGLVAPISKLTHGFIGNMLSTSPIVPSSLSSLTPVKNANLGQPVKTLTQISNHVPTAANSHAQSIKISHVANQAKKTKIVDSREYRTVQCRCELTAKQNGKTPMLATLEDQEIRYEQGIELLKWTAKPLAQQDKLCDSCCQDHHDTIQMVRQNIHYSHSSQAPHAHYGKQLGKWQEATEVGDPYTESCRFIRQDGQFKLTTDWHLLQVNTFTADQLNSKNSQQDYNQYLKNWIRDYLHQQALAAQFSQPIAAAEIGPIQLYAKGIFIDRISDSHVEQVKAAISAGQQDWMGLLPLYEVDITHQVEWLSSNPNLAPVSNQQLRFRPNKQASEFTMFNKGRVTLLDKLEVAVDATTFTGNSSVHKPLGLSPIDRLQIKLASRIVLQSNTSARSADELIIQGDTLCSMQSAGIVRPCNYAVDTSRFYVDPSKWRITDVTSAFDCEVSIEHFPLVSRYQCLGAKKGWKGAFSANGTQNTSMFWLDKNGRVYPRKLEFNQAVNQHMMGRFELHVEAR